MGMAEVPPLLLLDGQAALDLAARLMASGYRTAQLPAMQEPVGSESAAPAAVILSPGLQDHIPLLRRRWGSLPILLGCPDDNVEGRCLALSSGADDLWLTSAGPSDLLSRLRLHLRLHEGNREEHAATIVVGDLEVDPRKQTVLRNGLSLALTTREFQLLLLLLRHSPKVVGREQILKEIWPEERTASSNVIEVYVRYLRRKLETGDQPRLIHTVRGQGYSLRVGGP